MKRKMLLDLERSGNMPNGTIFKTRAGFYGEYYNGYITFYKKPVQAYEVPDDIEIPIGYYDEQLYCLKKNIPGLRSPHDLDIIAIGYCDMGAYYEEVELKIEGGRRYNEPYQYFIPLWKRNLSIEKVVVSTDEAFAAISRQTGIPAERIVLAK